MNESIENDRLNAVAESADTDAAPVPGGVMELEAVAAVAPAAMAVAAASEVAETPAADGFASQAAEEDANATFQADSADAPAAAGWQPHAAELRDKVAEFTQLNIDANLAFMREVMQSRDLEQIAGLQQSFVRESLSAFNAQATELTRIFGTLATQSLKPMEMMLRRQ